jgi:hypothetical protein
MSAIYKIWFNILIKLNLVTEDQLKKAKTLKKLTDEEETELISKVKKNTI